MLPHWFSTTLVWAHLHFSVTASFNDGYTQEHGGTRRGFLTKEVEIRWLMTMILLIKYSS